MKNDSDYELIKLVRNNDDKQSFQLLYNKYWDGLYKIALSKVGNEDDATDLVQDLFVTVWVKRKELNINENVDLYLFRALKNRIINFYRKKYLVEEKISLHTKNSVGFNDNTPDNIYLFKEVQAFINLEIEKLPEKMKEIFLLSREAHLSSKKISYMLAISDQTVRNQISKAIKRIKLVLVKNRLID